MNSRMYLSDVAKRFNVTRMTIHRWIKIVPLPGYEPKVGSSCGTVDLFGVDIVAWYYRVQKKLKKRYSYRVERV